MGKHDLTPVTEEFATKLLRQYPDMPSEYVEFLLEVGFGAFGDCFFSIYQGLIEPEEFYDPETVREFRDVMFFGADFNGTSYGFDVRHWEIIEITPTIRINRINKTFAEFLEETVNRI